MRRRYMNQKGFTLVELLATLAILAMLLLIAVPAIGGILDKAKVSADESSAKLIEKSAEKASVDKLPYDETAPEDESYTVPTLINEGYLSLDEDSPLNDEANYVVKDPTPGSSRFIYKGVGVSGGGMNTPGDGTGTPEPEPEEPVGPPETDHSFFTWAWVDEPNNEITITGYTGPKGLDVDIVIPTMLEDHTVVSIRGMGYYPSFKSVVLPNTLRVIEPGAFEDADLTSIHIPASVRTIGAEAFYSNPLTSVTFDYGVVDIGAFAFAGKSYYGSEPIVDFGTLVIPGSVETIGASAFSYAEIDELEILGSNLKQIGDKAFRNNNLTTFDLPNSVAHIGASSFAANSLTNVTLQVGLDFIGASAFATNPIETVIVYDRDVVITSNSIKTTNPSFVMRGYAGSTAETYAANYSNSLSTVTFELIVE